MRADRLLSILLLLQKHTKLTTEALAVKLEVSQRTIQRDIESLSGAGIPVYSERGRNGGWLLVEGYQSKLTGLNTSEIQSLFLSAPDVVLEALGLSQANHRALSKLETSLTDSHRSSVRTMQQFLHIDGEGWRKKKPDVKFLPILQETLWQHQKVMIRYKRYDESVVERILTPFGLVVKGIVWYLVGGTRDTIRTYRIDRIEQIEVVGKGDVPPQDFDLAEFWETSKQEFTAKLPRVPVTFLAEQAVLKRIQHAGWYSKIETVIATDDPNWHKVEMVFNTEADAISLAASFGGSLILMEPEDLQQKVLQTAKHLIEAYTNYLDSSWPKGML